MPDSDQSSFWVPTEEPPNSLRTTARGTVGTTSKSIVGIVIGIGAPPSDGWLPCAGDGTGVFSASTVILTLPDLS
jgi:hypothetical protein